MLRSLLLVVAVMSSTATAQSVSTRALASPVEIAEGFTAVAGAHELSSGRVLVSDNKERRVLLLDFTTRTARPVSRVGAGPVEYQVPRGIFAVGDSVHLIDAGNRRFLVFDATGRPVRSETFTPDGQRRQGLSLAGPEFVDRRGISYYRGGGMLPSDPARMDSDAVVRYDRRADVVTPVAHLPNPMVVTRTADGGIVGSIGPFPFGIQDAWAATPDGRVAIVRSSDYHVEWFSSGQRIAGPAIPFPRITVTESEKAEWRAWYAAQPFIGRGTGGPVTRPPAKEPMWPPYKGPFADVVVAPNGDLWVERRGREGDAPFYDVIDASGRLAARYSLPRATRVIAVSATAVYATRRDADDVLYVQRFVKP